MSLLSDVANESEDGDGDGDEEDSDFDLDAYLDELSQQNEAPTSKDAGQTIR